MCRISNNVELIEITDLKKISRNSTSTCQAVENVSVGLTSSCYNPKRDRHSWKWSAAAAAVTALAAAAPTKIFAIFAIKLC